MTLCIYVPIHTGFSRTTVVSPGLGYCRLIRGTYSWALSVNMSRRYRSPLCRRLHPWPEGRLSSAESLRPIRGVRAFNIKGQIGFLCGIVNQEGDKEGYARVDDTSQIYSYQADRCAVDNHGVLCDSDCWVSMKCSKRVGHTTDRLI